MRRFAGDRRSLMEWLLLGSALLVLGAILLWSLMTERAAIGQRERERLESQTKVVHDNLGRQLDAVNRALVSVRDDLPEWRTQPDGMARASQRLRAFAVAMTGVRTMTVLDARGVVVAANRPEPVGTPLGEREYFRAALARPDADTLYISPPFQTVLGVWAMNAVRMIPGANGEFAGIVSATLDPEEFSILLASVRYADDMWTAVAHGDGRQFLMLPERPGMAGLDLTRPGSLFMRHRESGRAVSVFTGIVYATGERRMMAVRSIQPSELHMDKPLLVAITRDQAALYADWNSEARALAGLYALLSVTGIAALYTLQRRQRRADEQASHGAQALAERERFLRNLIDILPGMVGYWTSELRCTFANSAYLEWFGKTPEQMRDIRMQDLMGTSLFAINEPYVRAALRGERQRFERTLTKADGTTGHTWAHYFPDVVDGEVRGFFVLVSDITDLKRTELALREALLQADRFREALDHVTSFIYMKDANRRYVYANRPTLDLFGVTADELPGSPDSRFFPPAAVRRIAEVDDRVLAGERTSEEIEVVDESGRRVYWEVKTPIYADADGKAVWGLCGISTDITARKLTEEELERARTAAEAASRAKSAFVANMSHEIRTPMNAVLGLLQLLQQTPLSARQLEYARKAQGAARSLLAILNDILDFSKVEAGKLHLEQTPLRLDTLLRNLSVVLSAAVEGKDVEVLFELDPAIPSSLHGDPLRLQQVLLNLAGNAVKFTESGEVLVAARLIESTPSSARIEFSVLDTGIGIQADRLDAVFEVFTQAEASTSRRYGGTGLGLAISQRLVQLMGGEIVAQSTPGHGSLFHFALEFPCAGERPETEGDLLRAVAGAAQPRPLQVLIVDDNPTARQLLAEMTESFGWRAQTVTSGSEAIARMQSEADAGRFFDAVCVDSNMRGMDGLQTIERIRDLDAGGHAPLVVMIGSHGLEVLADRLGPGARRPDAFLVKPFAPSTLLEQITQAAMRRCGLADWHPPPLAGLSGALAGMRILVVEDNALNRQIAQELLGGAGALVEVANDGLRGVARVEEAKPPFDAVLMDVQMPGMDGHEATRILRARGATLPIIAMTANALPADRAACLAAGMDDHVGKPIDLDELVETLLRHCPDAGSRPGMDRRAPAAPAEAQPQPPMPAAIDLTDALARHGGNKALFARLAARFDGEQQEIAARVERALRSGDRATAMRELHTLRGLAVTFGARALANAVGAAEALLAQENTPTDADALLAALREPLAQAAATLRDVARASAAPDAAASEGTLEVPQG